VINIDDPQVKMAEMHLYYCEGDSWLARINGLIL